MTGIHKLYIHNNFGRSGWLHDYNFIVTGFNKVFFFFGKKKQRKLNKKKYIDGHTLEYGI